ncbi:MAG: YhjD/YihY/BrkB family envelope integrity protein [Clostridiaceae bacterium]
MRGLRKIFNSILLLLRNYDLTYILAFQMLASLVTFFFLFIIISRIFLVKVDDLKVITNCFSDSIRPFVSSIIYELSDKAPNSFASFNLLAAIFTLAALLFFSSSVFRSIRYVLGVIFKIDYRVQSSGVLIYIESFLIVIVLVAYLLFLIFLVHSNTYIFSTNFGKYISLPIHFFILFFVGILIYYLYFQALKIKFRDSGFSFYALYGSLFSMLINISGSLLLKRLLIYITQTPTFAIYGNIYILICWFILISFSFVLCAELTYGLREQNLSPKRILRELLR